MNGTRYTLRFMLSFIALSAACFAAIAYLALWVVSPHAAKPTARHTGCQTVPNDPLATARAFIVLNALRHNPYCGYWLASDSLHAGQGRREWGHGNIQVLVPNLNGRVSIRYRMQYQSGHEVRMLVALSDSHSTQLYDLGELYLGRWRVNYFWPRWTPSVPRR